MIRKRLQCTQHATLGGSLLPLSHCICLQATAKQSQLLKPNQHFDLWLELAIPDAHADKSDELFQVPCHEQLCKLVSAAIVKLAASILHLQTNRDQTFES